MSDKTRKYLQWTSYFTLFLMFLSLIVYYYWNLKPYTPIVFNSAVFQVEEKQVVQGGYLTYTIDYCKENDLIPHLTRTFIDGIVYTTPDEPQPFLEEGCHQEKFFIYIPKALPPGNYVIKQTYTFQVNPIRKIDIYTETEPFKVVAR